ncbi:autotransporter outer membrane beta-barrel domain-containing protein [Methylococcus sp. EFPC2]|uniref:autotransporter family protein n=1 Tax=Methylococcus sp. EFPC2 TaxID=2812648 RepID=UPI0019686DA8|nr:autotransporter outer membrane beta-barrel domain-containing protein [Methylococcus sp. EFPC2]QSA96391.1 autotransporter domain-containing protein [Methylococcus sp. EFPC2]
MSKITRHLRSRGMETLSVGMLLACSSGPAFSETLSSDVSWSVIGRNITISNPAFTAAGDGTFAGNAATVSSGSSITLTGAYSIQEGDTSYCPFCVIQLYTAWISPAPANSQGFYSGEIFPGFGSLSGVLPAWTSDAPKTPGTYYIGLASTLDFFYHPNMAGAAGADAQGIPGAAPYQVTVIPIALAPNPSPNTLSTNPGYYYSTSETYINGGTLTNNGATIQNPGTFINQGTVAQQGEWENSGSIINSGQFDLPGNGHITGTGTYTQTSGLTNLSGSLQASQVDIQGGTFNLSGGSVQASTFVNQGVLNYSAGSLQASLANRGTVNVQGEWDNSGSIINSGQFDLTGNGRLTGTGTYTQTAGLTNLSSSLQASQVDIQGGTFNLSGGSVQTSTFVNQGVLNYSAGSFQASLLNRGVVNVSGVGAHVVGGDVLNRGTFNVTETTVSFGGTFTNEGAYISDPSLNQFQNLSVGAEGYLVGGEGDVFVVSGDFQNGSTQSSLWETSASTLVFAGGSGQHVMGLAGEDRGAQASAFLNNFSWGTLALASGDRLNLTDGNTTPGAALYARRIVLPGGTAQLASVFSDYNVYFDPSLTENQYLLGASLGGGKGRLLPWSFVPGLTDTGGTDALTENEQTFAAAVDESCTAATGQLAERCLELQALDNDGKNQAVQSLTPDQTPTQTNLGIKFNNTRMDAPLARLASLRVGGVGPLALNFNGYAVSLGATGGAAGDEPFRDSPLGVFIQGKMSLGDKDEDATARGFHYETRNVTVGADYRFNDNLVAGVALSYANTNTVFAKGSGEMNQDSVLGGLYGSLYLPQDYYVDWLVNYGGLDYTLTRQLAYSGFSGKARSTPGGDQFGVSVSGGRDFAWKEWLASPILRFEYSQLNVDAYREKGGGGLGLNADKQSDDSLVSDLGAQIGHNLSLPWGVVTPALRVEWEHQYLNDNRSIHMRLNDASAGLGAFTVNTGKPDRDYLNLGGSVAAVLPNGGSAFLRYETRLGQSSISNHIVELGLRLNF